MRVDISTRRGLANFGILILILAAMLGYIGFSPPAFVSREDAEMLPEPPFDFHNIRNPEAPKIHLSVVTNITQGKAPLKVSFQVNTIFDPEIFGGSRVWDFGDGEYGIFYLLSDVVTHTYSQPGVYNAELILNAPAGGCAASLGHTQRITVPKVIVVTE